MMQLIIITKASLVDLVTLQKIGRATFYETFADSNTEADMAKYLEESFSDEKMRTELSNPDSCFFIAWENDNPVGYLKLNSGRAQTELLEENSIEIERIYVSRDFIGKNVGQQLYEKSLEIAVLQKKVMLWLAVWEKNERAIRFYLKNGFVPFDKHIFKLGDDEQTDIMMKKLLGT